MMIDRRHVLAAALGAVALCATSCVNDGSGQQVIAHKPGRRALIYRGPASSTGCPEACAEILSAEPLHLDVDFVGPAERFQVTSKSLDGAALYVQPGGGDDLDAAWRAVAPFADELKAWINAGGAYLGCCMGGFLAGQGPGFNLLPGDSERYITTSGAEVHTNDDALVTVSWRDAPQSIFFQGGPAFAVDAPRGDTVVARYTNGTVAAGVFAYGNGAVGVTGPHPEAPLSWYVDSGLAPPSPLPHARFVDLVTTTMLRAHLA